MGVIGQRSARGSRWSRGFTRQIFLLVPLDPRAKRHYESHVAGNAYKFNELWCNPVDNVGHNWRNAMSAIGP